MPMITINSDANTSSYAALNAIIKWMLSENKAAEVVLPYGQTFMVEELPHNDGLPDSITIRIKVTRTDR